MDFSNAQLLTYTHENTFLSDGEFRIGGVKQISIETFIDFRPKMDGGGNADNSGVAEIQEEIQRLILNSHNYEDIIINGHNLGSGKINGVNFPASQSLLENNVRFGKAIYEIEIIHSGEDDLYNLDGDFLSGVKSALSGHQLLQNFSEDFSFDLGSQGEFSYTHNVDAQYISGLVGDPIIKSQHLASGLFSLDPSFGFINSQKTGFYNTSGKKTFSETYSLTDGTCSFSKTFESMPQTTGENLWHHKGKTFSYQMSHEISSDKDKGIISVEESADIEGMDEDNRFDSAVNGLNILLDGAVIDGVVIESSMQRCSGIWNNYSGFMGSGGKPYHGLVSGFRPWHISLGKTFNELEGRSTYKISFNNDYAISGNLQHDFSLNLTVSEEGVTNITEQGNIIEFDIRRSTSDPVSWAYPSERIARNGEVHLGLQPLTRAYELYNSYMYKGSDGEPPAGGGNQRGLTETSSSISYSKSGKALSYSKEYSDDFRLNGDHISYGVKRMESSVSDIYTKEITQIYSIPNQDSEIVHKRGLHTLSSRDVSVDAIIERGPYNYFCGDYGIQDLPVHRGDLGYNGSPATTWIPTPLQVIINEATIKAYEAANVDVAGMHLTSCNYSVSNLAGGPSLQLNLTVSYLE